jgi:hypothetical protein
LLATRHAYCPVDALMPNAGGSIWFNLSPGRALAMRECPTAKSRIGRPWQGFCARRAEEPLPNGTPIEDAMSIGTKRHKQLIELLTGFAGLPIHIFPSDLKGVPLCPDSERFEPFVDIARLFAERWHQ